MGLLLPSVGSVRVGGITIHAVIEHILGLCNGIAPEGRRFNSEVFDDTSSYIRQGQGDRSSIPICFRMGLEVFPPWLKREG